MNHLVEGPITDLIETPVSSDFGARASFSGIIRADKMEGLSVSGIEYSAYRPMAERILAEIADDIREKYQLADLILLHSIGFVAAGECSMWIAVYAKHRKEAFDALRETVERVKFGAPVWKKEKLQDGEERWVEGKFWDENQGI
jgi:molybdopterin synthase catalytic subunit